MDICQRALEHILAANFLRIQNQRSGMGGTTTTPIDV